MQPFLQLGVPEKNERASSTVMANTSEIVLPAIANGENLRFEPFAFAALAGRINILEEVHLQFFDAGSFAALATAAPGVERKMSRCESLPQRLAFAGK